jgi:hypothetical protein
MSVVFAIRLFHRLRVTRHPQIANGLRFPQMCPVALMNVGGRFYTEGEEINRDLAG